MKILSVLVVLSLLVQSVACFEAGAVDLTVAEKRDQLEGLRRQAVDHYNLRAFEDSEKEFYQVLSTDYQSSLATYAIEFLKKITVETGAVQKAISDYREKRKSGEIKSEPLWSPTRQAAFENLRRPGKLEEHLFSIFKVGGVIAARTSLISVILDAMGLTQEATYYFDQAELLVDQAQSEAWTQLRDYLMLRPLHYVWPSMYPRIGVPTYSRAQLEVIPFIDLKEVYPSVSLRRNMAGWHTHFGAGVFTQYDSNAVLKSDTGATPAGISHKEGMEQNYLLNVGAAGNLAGEISYGWDYILYQNHHMRDDLAPYNWLSHIPSAWVSFWNKKDNEIRARYDVAFTLHEAVTTEVYSRTHGPQFAWGHLWNQRYRVDLSYSFKFNQDDYEPVSLTSPDRRGGTEHGFELKISYPGKNKRSEPYFGYRLGRNLAEGGNYNLIQHGLDLGSAYLIGKRSVINFGTSLDWMIYPGYITSRVDQLTQVKAGMAFPFIQELLLFTVNFNYSIQNSDFPAFEYKRMNLGAGLVFSI